MIKGAYKVAEVTLRDGYNGDTTEAVVYWDPKRDRIVQVFKSGCYSNYRFGSVAYSLEEARRKVVEFQGVHKLPYQMADGSWVRNAYGNP